MSANQQSQTRSGAFLGRGWGDPSKVNSNNPALKRYDVHKEVVNGRTRYQRFARERGQWLDLTPNEVFINGAVIEGLQTTHELKQQYLYVQSRVP